MNFAQITLLGNVGRDLRGGLIERGAIRFQGFGGGLRVKTPSVVVEAR